MNAGRVLEFLWMWAFWTFIIAVFVIPIVLSHWYANERKRAEDTEEALQSLGFDTSHEHEWDAL